MKDYWRHYDYHLDVDDDRVTLRGTGPDGDEVGILQLDGEGITMCDINHIDGLPMSLVPGQFGRAWEGTTVRFDGVDLTSEDLDYTMASNVFAAGARMAAMALIRQLFKHYKDEVGHRELHAFLITELNYMTQHLGKPASEAMRGFSWLNEEG